MKRPDLKKMTFDVIINATPVGMGNTRETPLQDKEINARYVFDMVYDPAETRLLKLAKERGAQVIPGNRNVRPPGGPPVRDLDRKTGPVGRDAASRTAGPAGARQPCKPVAK